MNSNSYNKDVYREISLSGDSFESVYENILNEDLTIFKTYSQQIVKYYFGDSCEGNFKNNGRYGKGKYTWKNGKIEVYECIYRRDHGPIVIYKPNKEIKIAYYSEGNKIFM